MQDKETRIIHAKGAQESGKNTIPPKVIEGLSAAAAARLRRYVESEDTPRHRAYGSDSDTRSLK